MRKGAGITLVALGVLALAGWCAWLFFAPVELPANLGRTPNPSQADWGFESTEGVPPPRGGRLLFYAWPAGALAAVVLGAVLALSPARRP